MIKLIATDLDGTLASHGGEIPNETFAVIEEAVQKDVAFVVATGRQTASVEKDFEQVLDKIYVIAENGGVVRKNRQDLYTTYLLQEEARAIIKSLQKLPDCFFVVCCKTCAYMNRADESFTEEVKKYYANRAYKEDLEQIEEPVVKIAIYDPEDITQNIQPYVEQQWQDDFLLTLSGRNWLDIGSKAINKGIALEAIQKELAISPDESMAFGDYYNDIELLKKVGHSYVMSHALDDVKAYGKYEAPTGGVLKIIKDTLASQNL